MTDEAAPQQEHRVLLRAATARDAAMTRDVLARAGIAVHICNDLSSLVDELQQGAGALMVAEEATLDPAFIELTGLLSGQPPWSDIPVIVLARQGADSRALGSMMSEFSNVTVIERPMRVASLVSVARSALRARRRQYDTRSLLAGLQEADRRKTEFLATLAHELRNPLAPMTTALALLSRKAPGPEESARYYALMKRQIEHMVRLINDLMEVSRITRNKIDMQSVPVSLDQVIDDAIELSRPQLDAARHTLAVEFQRETLVVRGDSVRLTQVFSNLLNNAAKYTPAGGAVKLIAWADGPEAVVEVIDNGIGIAREMLKPIFEMFVQVSGTSKVAQGGLGIGLTLVNSLVELHGGRVVARSAGANRGSTFTVRLPLLRQPPASGHPASTLDGETLASDRWILVVDDNRDAADSLAELLRAMGATTLAAYSGEEALRVSEGRHIDAAVLDIGMPGMDGCDLAVHLRQRAGGAELTLIALTGWGQPEDRQRIAAAGFDHHLLKPVNASELLTLV